jgi:arginine utilization protein RocB
VEEAAVAHAIYDLLCEGGHAAAYALHGLEPLEGDPWRRHNVYALLPGKSPRTVVLLGHYDTVGTEDYGSLEAWATDSARLAEHTTQLSALDPDLAHDLTAFPDDWLYGRGTADMKTGVAVNLALTRRLAAAASAGAPCPVTVLFLATPDEENESAGVLAALRLLARLRDSHGLQYLGVLNTDYTTARYPGDHLRYVYTGTIGKLLPGALVIGAAAHVGAPFDGMDANLLSAELIRRVSMDDGLADQVRGQLAPPPVTLRATDLKDRYDVQLPFAAYCCFNVLTLETGSARLLERLRDHASAALSHTLEVVATGAARWSTAAGWPSHAAPLTPGGVLTYAELLAHATTRLGAAHVTAELHEAGGRWAASMDARERCARLALRLWTLSGLSGPALVLFYAPPYYPHVPSREGPLVAALRQVIAAQPQLNIVEREFYPFISDLSYLGMEVTSDTAALEANMPTWCRPGVPAPAGAYTLPFVAMRELAMPVINVGPYGRGAHRAAERVLMSYSFEALPRLLWETLSTLGDV